MIRLVHSALILILVVTGIALGSARGQAQVAGQIVICAGSVTISIAVDDQGQPVEQNHFCPDMALSLLAAIADAGQPDRLLPQPRRIGWTVGPDSGQSHDIPPHSARDPPVVLS
ncbi:MAG: hypothetical protein Q4G22_03285 [Paracoccus sp. (in: a-proteobacteria)]|uniref:hypothetical protein n=1 Tax=Paracoccus sp. TaxID=267 RepID=UPI0026DF8D85|nr:hypothetical protein [Paracoccus sp. (in: a-proteobacteria)]MDO5630841.1 hypothetical protein [Paracoccus sp. (in: a-proteobacteria)]